MIVDCIADLHGFYPELEGGDLLIIAGDLTAKDTIKEYKKFNNWICNQTYRKIIFIGGNHDNCLKQPEDIIQIFHGDDFPEERWANDIKYLCDSGTEFEGLKIWGSPWTKTFPGMNPHCKAFTYDTEEELAEKWAMISEDTDILITHSPPYGIHDKNIGHIRCGSKALYERLIVIKPRVHVFGHIHEQGYKYSKIKHPIKIDQISDDIIKTELRETHCINSSHVNEKYQPVNKPIRVIL